MIKINITRGALCLYIKFVNYKYDTKYKVTDIESISIGKLNTTIKTKDNNKYLLRNKDDLLKYYQLQLYNN